MYLDRTARFACAFVVGLIAVLGVFPRREPKFTPTLHDPRPAVRAAAIRAMGWRGDPALLIPALHDKDPDVRLLAAVALGGQGPDTPRRVAALVEALNDEHWSVRRELAESLCSIGPESGPALLEALTDTRPRVRAGAALALSGDGPDKEGRKRTPGEVEAAVPLLRDLLQDFDSEVRRNAAYTLHRMHRSGPHDAGVSHEPK